MSTSPRRRAERLARQTKRPVLEGFRNADETALRVGAAAMILNQSILDIHLRNEAHATLDALEANIRSSEEAIVDFLAVPADYVAAAVQGWRQRGQAAIEAGTVSLGLTICSIGTTVTHDRLYLLARDLTAERANRPSETASPEAPTG